MSEPTQQVAGLARELGVDSKTVLAKLKEMGEFVKSASSTVEAPTARRVRGALAGQTDTGVTRTDTHAATDSTTVVNSHHPLGLALRQLRISAGKSLAEVAEAIHYSRGFLSKVETGHTNPRWGLVKAYVEAVGGDPAAFKDQYFNERSHAHSLLANELKRMRLGRGESLRAAAQAVGYGAASLSDAENGKTIPGWDFVRGLVEHYEGDVDQVRNLYLRVAEVSDDSALGPSSNVSAEARAFTLLLGSVPTGIRAAFLEAAGASEAGAYTTSLALARWMVEAISADAGFPNRSAKEGLLGLAGDDLIDRRLLDWGSHVLHISNRAVHSVGTPVQAQDADDAVRFLSALITQIYVIRAGYNEFQARMDSGSNP